LATDPDGDDIPRAPVLFTLSHTTLAFASLGDSIQLTVRAKDAFGDEVAEPAVAWASSDFTVAEVSEQGMVVARGNGAARVIATLGALADTVSVTVGQVVAAGELSREGAVLAEGDTLRLVATFTDSLGSPVPDDWISWSSTNPRVLMVDSMGLVTARRAGGAAEVIASAGGRNEKAMVRVMDQIAFVYGEEIYLMNEDGSGARALTTDAKALDLIWAPDGREIAFRSYATNQNLIQRIDLEGGDPDTLAVGDFIDFLDWSPDARRIAFTWYEADANYPEIHVMDRDGSNRTNIAPPSCSCYGPRWSPDGRKIAYLRVMPIGAVGGMSRFFIDAMNPNGSGHTTIHGSQEALSAHSWSPDGSKILAVQSRDVGNEVVIANADGDGATTIIAGPTFVRGPVWSPDGKKFAFTRMQGLTYEVFVANPDGSGVVNVTTGAESQSAVTWSPDGQHLLFWTLRDGTVDLYRVAVAGGTPVLLFSAPWVGEEDYRASWRPRPRPE
jgi:Tol biopolymer transport system component